MKKSYSVNRSQDLRRIKPEVIIFVLLVLAFASVIIYVYLDLNRNRLTIDNSRNNAVLGAFDADLYPYKTIETEYYRVDIPESWVQVANPEIRVSGEIYYPERHQGAGLETGRRIDIHIDRIPRGYAVHKIKVVEIINNELLRPIEQSPQCDSFTNFPSDDRGTVYRSSWQSHGFYCLTTRQGNSVAAVSSNYEEGLTLKGENGVTRNVMLIFTDHSGSPDNSIFDRILESFRLK